MAVDQYFGHELRSISEAIEGSEKKTSACFDCNICLDFANDPVVTLCGHLYCWPCIYEWFNVQDRSDNHLQCPVCKTELSLTSVVPLYGSGKKVSESDQETKLSSLKVPPRPSPPSLTVPTSPRLSYLSSNFNHGPVNNASPSFSLGMNQNVEIVYGRVFGNSGGMYSYPLSGNGSPRLRRQEMQADKSLNRITIFLFCCLFLCLLLF
ncbi:unnamed protein product [Cuscuta epithymum]|uniref:E3 ubiquitin-protein ligase RMA n=1 Tax=Cuscuta epithymum TaxID=186058 RepID=A0AAV0DVS1_9ASTE|nr:unnamed protein product [Cuscuta epithymum]CAH9123589.1 unnamed protein product [Cuscuta epithymum]